MKAKPLGKLALYTLLMLSSAVLSVSFVSIVTLVRLHYFDVNNGWAKTETKVFGLVFQQTIDETAYSKTLKQIGLMELVPDWKLAMREKTGIWRLLNLHSDFYLYGQIQSDSRQFSEIIDSKKYNDLEAFDLVKQFRALVMSGNRTKIKEFVLNLSKE